MDVLKIDSPTVAPPVFTFDELVADFMIANDCDRDEAERRVAAAKQRGKIINVDGKPLTFGAPD